LVRASDAISQRLRDKGSGRRKISMNGTHNKRRIAAR
jgi:hypothetical protein